MGYDCRYAPTGQCGRTAEICVAAMSNKDDAHIADCTNNSVPHENLYSGALCCKVQELCYDGVDNDGDTDP